ncbi:alcohol dehydrogenase [Dactylonectria estremocensis]|uniref:Alcohol dehydrogenase n=1 Tax=Dactylonectria estremocensis TaxID=1079267 RepID=A0A9P9DUW2_9HYPO|nr:alcohol dehydrogenase [Dactylonectria estremocensis]
MRAVAWYGQPRCVRITSSAICGSDLHFYHGYGGSPNVPWGLGHEAVGFVSEIGDAVTTLNVGDYVIIPDNADDGQWGPAHPLSFGTGAENYGGLQAEYARVPFADNSLIQIPINSTHSEAELDYLMVADVFTTGWHSLTYSGFEAGDSVAVFGAGPVGLLAAYSAILRGASRVYVVDRIERRLEIAKSIGAVAIDFSAEDPIAAILAQEPEGVTRSLDCVGFESTNSTGQMQTGIVLEQMIGVTTIYGGMGIAGVYNGGSNSTSGAPFAGMLPAEIPFPMAALWRKGLQVGSGIVLPLLRAPPLLELIASSKASPSFVVSAEISIEEAPEYYKRYSDHLENKVVIRFP